ncbi:MAG TPA: gluconate 2-dehydrogenase subunit 3 family protein [Bryobacteraceae bacterium]
MKRRRFMQALAVAPAVPALAQQVRPATPSGGRGRGSLGVEQGVKVFEVTPPDAVADPTARFFTPAQFGALRKLSDALMPAMGGNPGAIECEAPEFLDFLIGVSPADRQQLYRGGLDALNAKAKAKFAKSFAELDAKQVDAVIRPLLAATPWAWDLPKDPAMRFIASVRTDVMTATRNSPAWAEKAGTRGGGAGQLKWLPIDPVYKG